MFDRAKVVDENFKRAVIENNLPSRSEKVDNSIVPSRETLLQMFESQIESRLLDIQSRKLKNSNQSFYTIGSSGHEGNAVLGNILRVNDMAFLHYRSCAFVLERAKKVSGQSPLYDALLAFVASSEDPIAGGRHKVLGSLSLNIPPQTSTIASHLPKAMGAAFSIARAESLQIVDRKMDSENIVFCNFGDASLNHSTAIGAINSVSWASFQNLPVPILFCCEDNGIGISVHTPEGWVEANMKSRPGIKYFKCDGLNILDTYHTAFLAAQYVRQTRRPAFLHMKVVRLMGHAGSDIESSYHSIEKIVKDEALDPLLFTAKIILEKKYLTNEQILEIYQSTDKKLDRIGKIVSLRPKLTKINDVAHAIVPKKLLRKAPAIVDENVREKFFGSDFKSLKEGKHHLAKLINFGLTDILIRYQNTLIFGEDVAQKGGVYYVTAGLYKTFGAKRVFNTLLDEQTILGLAIGAAHNGFVPIPEIQFLAYIHNAEDQIRGEAATLSFFSNQQFVNPMVIRIAGLGYQKGFGGHFHNDNSLAIFRDIPGIIIACPSNGEDAVLMMRRCVRAAFEFGRVCVFIEPIALYMTKDLHDKNDLLWSFQYPSIDQEIELGEFKTHGDSSFIILTYGNGVYLSLQAQKILLEKHNLNVEVCDLRWIAPLEKEALVQYLKKAKKVLIVEECRKTGSWSEGLVSLLVENLSPLPQIKIEAAFDSFVPIGVGAACGLPSCDSIVLKALEF